VQVDFELVVELLKPVYTLSLKRSRNDFFHNIVSILRCLPQQIALIGMYGDIIEMTADVERTKLKLLCHITTVHTWVGLYG